MSGDCCSSSAASPLGPAHKKAPSAGKTLEAQGGRGLVRRPIDSHPSARRGRSSRCCFGSQVSAAAIQVRTVPDRRRMRSNRGNWPNCAFPYLRPFTLIKRPNGRFSFTQSTRIADTNFTARLDTGTRWNRSRSRPKSHGSRWSRLIRLDARDVVMAT